MKSFKGLFFFFYLYVCRGCKVNATLLENATSTKNNPKPLMCFLHSSSGLMQPGGCEWPSLCLPSKQCQVLHCLACTCTDWNWEGVNEQWCWGRGCLIYNSLVDCMNFWHKYLRSKWLKKYIKNPLEVWHNKCILLSRGLNAYNEPAQALMTED